MSASETMTTADLGDRHRRQAALALVLLGLTLGASAVEYFVASPAADLLEYLQIACALGTAGLLLPTVVWKLRHGPDADWHLYRGEDGFVADSIARAQIASWSVSFVLVCVLSVFDRTLSGVPADTLLRIVAAVMATVFGGAFLYLTRSVPEEEDGGLGEAPGA